MTILTPDPVVRNAGESDGYGIVNVSASVIASPVRSSTAVRRQS